MDLWLFWQSLLQVPVFLVQMEIQMKMRVKLENTSWSSVETLSYNSLSVATDKKESNTVIISKMEVCQD